MSIASQFSTQMAGLVANAGGAVNQLPAVNVFGARERTIVANFAYAAQAAGTVIGVARLPMYAVITGITVITDTSTGSATIAIGDANAAALYAAAQVYTSVNTPTKTGNAATHGTPITVGYDCTTGKAVTYQSPGEGGALYEDVILTTAVAALPASGNLTIIFEYALD
jgi:hypothetical protein